MKALKTISSAWKIGIGLCAAALLLVGCSGQPETLQPQAANPAATSGAVATQAPTVTAPVETAAPIAPATDPTQPQGMFEASFESIGYGDLTVEETRLGPAGDLRLAEDQVTENEQFFQRIPLGVVDRHLAYAVPSTEPSLEEINAALDPFGYQLTKGDITYSLAQDGKEIAVVVSYSNFQVNQSGTDFVLLVKLDNYQNWIVQKDRFELFYEGMPKLAPVFIGDALFSVDLEATDTGSQAVVRQDGEVVYTAADVTPGVETCPIEFFRAWEGHWILQINGEDIMDGQPLGAAQGYQKAFNWHLAAGKPIYLFQKEDTFGVSYAGEELPLRYDYIVRWNCVAAGPYFPFGAYGEDGLITFFAIRDGDWYFVQIGDL